MRIAQVIHQFLPLHQHGSEIYTYTLSKELQKNNQVFIFCREDSNTKIPYKADENFDSLPLYKIYYAGPNSFETTYNNQILEEHFNRFLSEVKPDIIHFQHLERLSASLIFMAKQRNIPSLLTLHDYWFICPQIRLLDSNNAPCDEPYIEDKCLKCLNAIPEVLKYQIWREEEYVNLFLKFFKSNRLQILIFNKVLKEYMPTFAQIKKRFIFLKNMLNLTDVIIAPSNFLKERFITCGVPKEKIIHCNFGIKQFKDANDNKNCKKITFGFIGAIAHHKGLHILVRAFMQIKWKNCELKIFGHNFNDAYFKMIKKSIKKDNRIHYCGAFDYSLRESAYYKIDILVMPSIWYENSPLVILEALANRIPVIASNLGGIPELINHMHNGLLFRRADVEDLVCCLRMLTNNPGLIMRLKNNCIAPKDIKTHAQELSELYQKIRNKTCR